VKIKKGEDVLKETKSGSDGSYSLEAELEDGEIYCVEVSKSDIELSTCFEYGKEDKVVNVNPVTTVSAMLYKNEKKDLKESDVTSRVYFKIGSGKNLYDLDYTVYEGVSAGFESVKNALGAKGLNEAITSVYNDIISATDIAFNFSYLFNGFIVNAESREIVLEENKSSTAELYLKTSSEEIADDFDIRWLVPDVAEKEGVHKIEETVSNPGEIPVITRLIYRNKEGSVITLASRTTVITALAVTSSTEIDVEDSDSMVHKKVNDSIFLSFPAGVSVTKDGKPVEKITFKEISNLSGTAISRFILEPSGAVFKEDTPLYVTLNLDDLFSGHPSVLFTERVSNDGERTILPSSSGDPIMLSTSGDPIMSKVFSGDPIMMGDSIMDENMKRALTFTTQHFSRFNNDISSLNFLAVMSAWYSNPELQVVDKNGKSLNPWGFIVRSLEESSNKDAAILSEIFKDSGKTMELSQNLAAIFERSSGSVDNYTIFENYYWIWRFLTDLEENINDSAKPDSKIFPYTEMNLKKMMNFLFTSKTVALRTMTVSDMFRENVGFEIAETTLQNNDLPQMHKNSRKVFLGIPVSETPDSSVITLNSLANSVYMVFNKMLTGIKNPVVHSVPSAPISTDSLFCIWTSNGNDESAYTKCLTKPVKYSLNSQGFLSFPDGTEVTSEEAHAMLIYRFPEIVKASALQKKNVLKALYMFTKYGSKAIVSAGDIESLKKDLYDSVALLLLELRNVIDTVSISEQSAVSDRTVFINSKLENSLSNVHSVNSFDRFLENIKISADSGALSGYAFNRAILTTGSKDIEKIKKDSQNRPVLIYADTQKTETTVHENISHSLFTDRGLRSDTTLFDVFNDIDISKLNKKLIEAQLTLFYSFKGREYIQKMDYIFSVYPSDELDIITVEPSTIEGSVVDSSSIMPISGATVILRPGNIISTSDVLGKF
ncbi:MAG TPA: hypothetical protein PKM18_04895, partial [bacterium]|nr:hypothetical protein [bacterium]